MQETPRSRIYHTAVLLVLALVWSLPGQLFAQQKPAYRYETQLNCANPASVTHLDLSYRHLQQLDSSLLRFANLQKLEIQGNDFTVLPAFIQSFSQLEYLDISYNSNLNNRASSTRPSPRLQQCTICHTPHGSPNTAADPHAGAAVQPGQRSHRVRQTRRSAPRHRSARRHQHATCRTPTQNGLRGADRVHQPRRPRRRRLRQHRHRSRHRPLRGVPHHHPPLHQQRDGVTALRYSVLPVPTHPRSFAPGWPRPALHEVAMVIARPLEASLWEPRATPRQPRAKPLESCAATPVLSPGRRAIPVN